jgi:hypothetical protein
MFGSPFAIDALHPKLQGVELLDLFGPMHLGLYLHVAQNVRRGYSDRFDCPDVIDRPSGGGLCGDLVPTHFARQCVTLIGGSENRLWHRDSLDSMYEWLRSRVGNGRFEKHILPGCGMQEMYWARNPLPVYATIEASFRLRYE